MRQFCYSIVFVFCFLFFTFYTVVAQCSICTKTAEQLGEGPASALNSAIVYLMAAPILVVFFIGYKWWKNEKRLNGNG